MVDKTKGVKDADISGYFKRKENVENTTSDKTGKDITKEISPDYKDVKMYSVDELAPNTIPVTIPYLEIYRTNELEYIPYKSPYNIGIQSTSEETTSTSSASTGDGATSDNNLTSDMISSVGADKPDDTADTASSFADMNG